MATKTLGYSIPIATVAAQTAVKLGETPFADGETCTLHISYSPGATGAAGVVKVQGSDDGTTNWTDKFILTGVAPAAVNTIRCSNYMRLNVTTGGTSGNVSAYLEGVT